MTQEEAKELYGPIVSKTDHAVVRISYKNGETIIRYHVVNNGVEQIPLGYVVGHSILIRRDDDRSHA
jgi:hypothetical protein